MINRDPLLKIYDNALLLTITRHGGQAKIYMQSKTRKALTFINFVGWDFSEVISEDARKAGVGLVGSSHREESHLVQGKCR